MPKLSLYPKDCTCDLLVMAADGSDVLRLIWPEALHAAGPPIPGRYPAGSQWQQIGEEDYVLRAATDRGVAQRVQVTASECWLDLQLTLTNGSDEPIGPGELDLCTHFGFIRELGKDEDTMQRAYLKTGGEWRKVIETERSLAREGKIVIWYMADGPALGPWPLDCPTPYGWGVSRDRAENPIIGVEARDGSFTVATCTPHPVTLKFNVVGPHGCLHSCPASPAIPPGGEHTFLARTWWMPGRFAELLPTFERALAELAARERALNYLTSADSVV